MARQSQQLTEEQMQGVRRFSETMAKVGAFVFVPVGIFLTGLMLWVSYTWMHGYAYEELVGRHPSAIIHPDDHAYRDECIRLVHVERTTDVREAIRREKQLKGWTPKRKLALITAANSEWRDLGEEWIGPNEIERACGCVR